MKARSQRILAALFLAAALLLPACGKESGGASGEARSAYRAALEDLLNQRVFPDGTVCDYTPGDDLSQNMFSLYDADNDGREELIVQFTTASMAGQVQYIFDYDESSKRLREELREFPLLTFYDNGVIKADWSHNQGLAGDFWPYSLYQYDPETDSYRQVGSADAWQKSFAETDSQGNAFPAEADTSGAGIVYYLMEEAGEPAAPVDQADYQKWVDRYLEGASVVELPGKALTGENIEASTAED